MGGWVGGWVGGGGAGFQKGAVLAVINNHLRMMTVYTRASRDGDGARNMGRMERRTELAMMTSMLPSPSTSALHTESTDVDASVSRV